MKEKKKKNEKLFNVIWKRNNTVNVLQCKRLRVLVVNRSIFI